MSTNSSDDEISVVGEKVEVRNGFFKGSFICFQRLPPVRVTDIRQSKRRRVETRPKAICTEIAHAPPAKLLPEEHSFKREAGVCVFSCGFLLKFH